jgi:hypothetical protein
MDGAKPSPSRILAISPFTRGFGFAVLEGERMLADWGTKPVSYGEDLQWSRKAERLILMYKPDVVIFQDFSLKGSTRSARMRVVNANMMTLARLHQVRVEVLSRQEILKICFLGTRGTKNEMAEIVAKKFPELLQRVPPKRRTWMPEDHRMSIFEAVGLALAFRNLPDL